MDITPDISGRLARLRSLMGERGWDAVVVRRIADIQWLTGISHAFDKEQAHTAVVTRERAWLHTDSRYYNAFVEGLPAGSSWEMDQEPVAHPAWAAARLSEAGARVVAVEEAMGLGFFDELSAAVGDGASFPRMSGEIVDLRMVKDADEIGRMRRAQALTDASFDHICGYIRPGQTEMEIMLELQSYLLTHGADGSSFSSIVASGPNGANPHARPTYRKVEEGDFIVMDWGATVDDYKSDMTRTVCVGEPSAEQRRVYDIVRETHEACAAMVRAGVLGCDVHNLSVRMIADAGYGEYYGHGLGHGVGLEGHERPIFNPGYDKPVPAGSVMTVEPGIYLPGRFGVRLEDYGLVTEDGFDVFTASTHDLVCVPC